MSSGGRAMTQQIRNAVTLVIDGREVIAPEGTMLVDAAKEGDVEIPVFCYEPKLGEPVGACRMCLVEIEGIPKLQTACSTPVRDGMVVYTQTDQVKEAQNAVVEFLLVNHPLDCPVCDKGGECPLQDIAMGWGPGKSRFTDPKRHFQKPLELSPLVAIDRERCILCYRCVALQPGGRRGRAAAAAGARRPQLRRHLRRAPLHRPLPRQHHRALPRRGADLLHLPLPRAALGHRGGGLGLHALPEPVQRQVHGPRRAGAAGARPRQRRRRRRLALRQGPLRLPDVQLRRPDHRADGPRRRRHASARSAGRRRSAERRRACATPDRGPRRWSAAAPRNEEGWLAQRLVRGLGSSTVDCSPNPVEPGLLGRALAPRADARGSPTSTTRARSSWSAPTRCTRCRSSTCGSARRSRRDGAKLLVASERPSALDGGAERAGPLRARRGRRLPRAPSPRALGVEGYKAGRPHAERGQAIAEALRSVPDPIIVWGERLWRDPAAVAALHEVARALGMHQTIGPGLLEVPEEANARGLREVGCLPGARPGPHSPPRRATTPPRSETAPPASGCSCSSTPTPSAPTRTARPGARPWRAPSSSPSRCSTTNPPATPTSSSRPRPTPRRRAPSPTPTAASSASAPTSPAPRRSAPAGSPRRPLNRPRATTSLRQSPRTVFGSSCSEVPFYGETAYEEIGGRGLRWQERDPGQSWIPEHSGVGAGGAPTTLSRRSRPPRAAADRRSYGGPPATDWPDPGHLQGSLGGRGHRAQPGAAVPDAGPAPRAVAEGRQGARARARRRGHASRQRLQRRGAGSRSASGCGRAPPS